MEALKVVETEIRSGNIRKLNADERVDVFKEKCEKLYEDLNLPNLPHEQRTKRTSAIETSRIKGALWEVWDDKKNNKIHKIKQLDLVEDLDIGDKRVFEIQRIEYDTCGFCGHPLIAEDYNKGVRVCEGCGSVEGTFVFEKPSIQTAEDLPENDGKLRYDEKQVIKLERRRKTRIEETTPKKPVIHSTDMQTWRKKQYLNTLDVIATQLQMTESQKDIVKHVICTYSLKMIHKTLGHQTIISALCRYILCREGRGRELRFSRDVFKDNNLTKNKYETIVINIKKWRIFGH